jgi:hypothetical protein
MSSSTTDQTALLLKEVLETLKGLQLSQTQLAAHVDAISGRVNILSGIKEVQDAADKAEGKINVLESLKPNTTEPHDHIAAPDAQTDITKAGATDDVSVIHARKPSVTSRIILT